MFTAKLIETKQYYTYYRKLMLTTMLPGSLYIFIILALEVNLYWLFIPVVFYILLVVYMKRISKTVEKLSNKRKIEITYDQISILGSKGEPLQHFISSELSGIVMKKEYCIPMNSLKEIHQAFLGKSALKNYIGIHQNGEYQQFEFILESYYMIEELKKLRSHWEESGIPIELIS